MQNGLILRTARGRVASELAYKHLGSTAVHGVIFGLYKPEIRYICISVVRHFLISM